MQNFMIKTDGAFGSKRTETGNVIIATSGHYNHTKPDNVVMSGGDIVTIYYKGGITRFKTEDGATVQQSVQYEWQFTI